MWPLPAQLPSGKFAASISKQERYQVPPLNIACQDCKSRCRFLYFQPYTSNAGIWYLLLFFHVVAAVYEFRLQQHYAAAFLDFFGGHAGIELGCEFIKADAATTSAAS